MNKFKSGLMSLEEWNGLWKADENEEPVTISEYDIVYLEFDDRLNGLGKVGYKIGCDFYFRGDHHGDRTQYLEIVNARALSVALIENLQLWLLEKKYLNWRILAITYLSEAETIMIYPEAVCLGRQLKGDWKLHIPKIAARM